MPKKIEQPEEELDIKKAVKKETFATRWFNDYASNNKEELEIVCELVMRSTQEQFDLRVDSGNKEIFGVVFYGTFLTILDTLKKFQKDYNNFTMEICNSINIGYTNNTNEDNEKVGNFMPIMEYIGVNKKVVDNVEEWDKDDQYKRQTRTTVNSERWMQINCKKNVEYYKDIQNNAFNKLLSEYRTDMRTSEVIIPCFCIFMDNIIGLLKVKYMEARGTDVSEVSMNVFGLFDAYYSFNAETNQECIEFTPNIRMKLAMKSDELAARD